jgi:hypothetical protein
LGALLTVKVAVPFLNVVVVEVLVLGSTTVLKRVVVLVVPVVVVSVTVFDKLLMKIVAFVVWLVAVPPVTDVVVVVEVVV